MTNFAFLFLQASGGGLNSILFSLMPFVLMIAVFYFLLILPQKRKQRELQAMIDSIKAGDRIVTSGGIIATVTAVRDGSLIVRSADKSMLEVSRASVAGLYGAEEKALKS